jgi:hypothetical protein
MCTLILSIGELDGVWPRIGLRVQTREVVARLFGWERWGASGLVFRFLGDTPEIEEVSLTKKRKTRPDAEGFRGIPRD